MDAAGASWLLERYFYPRLLPGCTTRWRHISFTGADPELVAQAHAIVDVGGEFQFTDPLHLRLDHHQMELGRETCAMRLAFRLLTHGSPTIEAVGADLAYLEPLVALVQAGDTGQLPAQGWSLSAELGLHALLGGHALEVDAAMAPLIGSVPEASLLAQRDSLLLGYAWKLLDTLAARLAFQHDVAAGMLGRRQWTSGDGLVWAFADAPFGTIGQGFAGGAAVCVASSRTLLPDTHTLEVWCRRTTAIDLRELWPQVVAHLRANRHPGAEDVAGMYVEKVFAVRGTRKSPNPTPPRIGPAELAEALDACWQR